MKAIILLTFCAINAVKGDAVVFNQIFQDSGNEIAKTITQLQQYIPNVEAQIDESLNTYESKLSQFIDNFKKDPSTSHVPQISINVYKSYLEELKRSPVLPVNWFAELVAKKHQIHEIAIRVFNEMSWQISAIYKSSKCSAIQMEAIYTAAGTSLFLATNCVNFGMTEIYKDLSRDDFIQKQLNKFATLAADKLQDCLEKYSNQCWETWKIHLGTYPDQFKKYWMKYLSEFEEGTNDIKRCVSRSIQTFYNRAEVISIGC